MGDVILWGGGEEQTQNSSFSMAAQPYPTTASLTTACNPWSPPQQKGLYKPAVTALRNDNLLHL